MTAEHSNSWRRATGGALLLLALVRVQAQLPVVPEDAKNTARERVDYGYCPGIVVGLRNTSGATYFSYGRTDLEDGPAVDENTIFEIGSITKVFTATLLADMAVRGELELTNAIQPWLPEGVSAPTWPGQQITLLHLASHTSGLPSAPTNLSPSDGNNPFAGYSVPQMYEFLASYKLTRAPGALYEYSNFGVGLLGELLARRAGVSYEALVTTWIADELGLEDTGIHLGPAQQARVAHGYSGVVPIPPFEMDALGAAGDLRSTAKDLLTFLAANRGWLATRLEAAMTETQRSRFGTGTPGLSIGLGWHLYTLNAGTAIWHNGATIGQRAFAGFVRNGSILAVVLANSDFDVTDLGFRLLDSTIPLASVRVPASVSELTLRQYAGRYERGVDDYFTIGILRGHLTLEYSRDLGRTFTLYPSAANRYYLTFPEGTGTFLTNSVGRATALVWTQAGSTTTYPRVEVPSMLSLRYFDGAAHLALTGEADRDYVIQASSDFVRWVDISTNTIWDNPMFEAVSEAHPRRFYRARER